MLQVSFMDIACPTQRLCYAVGSGKGGPNGFGGTTILVTADGGRAWYLQSNPLSRRWNAVPRSIACPSTTICYAVGGVRNDQSRTRYVILATKNGGTAWTFQTAPLGRTTNYTYQYGIACPATTTCYVVGGPRLVATTDGGRTWPRQSILAEQGHRGGAPAV